MNRLRRAAPEFALIVVSLLIGYVILEAGYRYYTYRTLPDKLFETISGQVPDNYRPDRFQRVFDLNTGWRYPPNTPGIKGHPWFSQWKTNSHGHVSDDEYPVEKPAGEYRIGVLGDSFTAGITNKVRWPALLEEKLNGSEAWRQMVGGKYIRVINFGVDGQGLEQMAKVAAYHAKPFDIDLMIVNFISDNILRKLFHSGNVNFHDAEDREQAIRAYIRDRYLGEFDWFVFRPELLAATVGKWIGLKPVLPSIFGVSDLLSAERSYERQEGIEVSAASLQRIEALYDNTLHILNPAYQELAGEDMPVWNWLVEDVARTAPGIEIVDMSYYMQLPESVKALDEWFYVPYDRHYSDFGVRKYADAVFEYLTTDYLHPGATAARGAVISRETVAAGRIGRKQAGGRIAKPGSNTISLPAAKPEKPVRQLAPQAPPKTVAGPVDGETIDRFEIRYKTYVNVGNPVSADGSAPDDSAAGILGRYITPRQAGSVIRVAVSVPGFAEQKTDLVVGLYYNFGRTATKFSVVPIGPGEMGTATVEHYFSAADKQGVDLQVRIGVGAGGWVFLNGDETGPRESIPQPQLIVEEIVPR